jgi:hypothetical protein
LRRINEHTGRRRYVEQIPPTHGRRHTRARIERRIRRQLRLAAAIVIKTDNLAAYPRERDRRWAMLKRLGIPAQIRLWRATYAGSDAGAVVVTVEYPSWAAFADGQESGG